MVTVPIGLALAGGGLYLMAHARQTDLPPQPAVRHAVTPPMLRSAAHMSATPAFPFRARDVDGRIVDVAQLWAEKPIFIYFVLNGCPCSIDAEPLFHHLRKQFGDRIAFVSVIDVGSAAAKKWRTEMGVDYPVIPDPKQDLMKAYRAERSTYNVLVAKGGAIDHEWPGYSASMLKDANARMAALLGEREKPFDPQYAPVQLASGCAFSYER